MRSSVRSRLAPPDGRLIDAAWLKLKSSAKHHFACIILSGCACGISDIVKRRSIRVWIAEHAARHGRRPFTISRSFRRSFMAQRKLQGERVVNDLVSEA